MLKSFIFILIFAGLPFANGVEVNRNGSIWVPKKHPSIMNKDFEPNAAVPVDFYYENLSGFHGNGEAFWLSRNGLVVVKVVVKALDKTRQKQNSLYKFKLDQNDSAELLNQLIPLFCGPPVVKDFKRTRTDPVRVYFGIRDSGEKMHEFQFWDHDWDRQPPPVQQLKKIAEQMIALGKKTDPLKTKEPTIWPSDFLPLPSHSSGAETEVD